jgi:hypothetical protein
MTNNSKENGKDNKDNEGLVDPSVYGVPDKYVVQVKFKEV